MRTKRRTWKRWTARLLCACLLLGLLPMAVQAEEPAGVDLGEAGIQVPDTTTNITWKFDDGAGTAAWNYGAKTLTLSGEGSFTTKNGANGITLPDGATLVVEEGAHWTVTAGEKTDDDNGYGLHCAGGLTVKIEEGASLSLRGGGRDGRFAGEGLDVDDTLDLTVASGGALVTIGGDSRDQSGGHGIFAGNSVTLDNEGTVTATGGKGGGDWDGFGLQTIGSLTVKGSGRLRCTGERGIVAGGSAAFNGGTTVALGAYFSGVYACTDGGTLTVGPDAVLVGASSDGTGVNVSYSGTPDISNAGGYASLDRVGADALAALTATDTERLAALASTDPANEKMAVHDTGTLLDLSGVSDRTQYICFDAIGIRGTVLWDPAADPAALEAVGDESRYLYLNGIKLPADKDAALTFTGICQVETDPGDTPAIQGGGKLTFFAQGGAVYIRNNGGTAISAGEGPILFTGGTFGLFSQDGAADQDILVTGGIVGLRGEAGSDMRFSALTDGKSITADPTQARSRGGFFARIQFEDDSGNFINIPGSPSNSPISYSGSSYDVMASIVDGLLPPPPPPSPQPSTAPEEDDDDPATYQVVYRPGYDGPSPVRDGGHERGDKVTVRESPFDAPAGEVFSGWSEKASGAAKYQPGDTLAMPSRTLDLYAVWKEEPEPEPEPEPSGPALDRTNHMAYLQGYPDGRVGPGDPITREQTAAIFFRLLDADSRTAYRTAESPFPDVADTRWSAEAVATMAKAGIIKGLPGGSFAPEAPITRAEFAAIAARFDPEEYSGPDLFPDIAGHWAAGLINQAARRGWVKGGADGLFRPDEPITRAEAAALINRMLERAPETAADLLPGMSTFPDNADPAAWYYLDLQEAANGHGYQRKPDGVHETWTELD